MTVTALRPDLPNTDERTIRWVPRRAGIVNVWRYYDEVFEFHRGRLLLRGANGSGKSKALELLLPFLFDASLRAQRLSTFGTSERTMHWNLMGDGASGTTRVGYVWMEFSTDADPDGELDTGTRRWFVCGARLQASAHTSSAQADYFTLTRQVTDGEFVTAAGAPLTRAALVERLGEDGVVHGGAGEHRAAVRTTLFGGISEQRYESLLLALLQLRTPKLSQRLDPSLLSTLLSRALPPLGETELAELAEGFERLDRQREELERLDTEVEAARRLANRQQAYARRVLRGAAGALISATSEMDRLTRVAREGEEALGAVRGERADAEERRATAEATAVTLDSDIEALRSHQDYQEGEAAVRRLDELRQRAASAAEASGRAAGLAETARRRAATDTASAVRARHAVTTLTGEAAELSRDSRAAAERAALGTVAAELDTLVLAERRRARGLLDGAVAGRNAEIAAVRRAVAAHATAVEARGFREEEVERAREELGSALTARENRAGEFVIARQARADALVAWTVACHELRLDATAVVDAVDDEPTLTALVDVAAERVTAELAELDARARLRRTTLLTERDAAVAELAQVRARRHVAPAAPLTRTADRSTRAGAPLWQLVDFGDGLPGSAAAGIEAALQAAGLLDAWVTPTGVAEVDGHDVLADPRLLGSAPARSLADVLRPEADTPVEADRVWALLRVVAYGEELPNDHPAAVGADGRWRLGPATGSWAKPDPEHIGATARARTRERRIAVLLDELERLDWTLAELSAVLDETARRRAVLAADRRARPGRTALDAARSAVERAELAVEQADRAAQQWAQRLAAAAAAVTATLRALTELAAGSGLPTGCDALDRLSRAIDDFRGVAGRWLDRRAELDAATERAVLADGAAEQSSEAAAEREEDAGRLGAEAHNAQRAVETVEGSLGREYHEIVDRITVLRGRMRDAEEVAVRERTAVHAADVRIASLQERARRAADERDAAIARRDATGGRVRDLCAGTFPADAGVPEIAAPGTDGVRPTLEAARAVAARWPDVPHGAQQIEAALARLAEELHGARAALGTRADLILESDGEHQLLTALAGGVRTGAAGLLDVVAAEARRARDDITSAERELFETTLTGDTRRHLADRIRQANAMVDGMNERLREVRTASDVAVELLWQIDPELPASARTARELLLRNPARLSDGERTALHRFFRERVDEARTADTSASWEQQLGEVFDYTAWHRFVVRIDRGRGEGMQPLTKKLHGALSGGEKAIALHLPLFAAVAAHYEVEPRAPRVILLDEVFVGVDTANRGQVFALLASLDLDLVLTSDHEWCAYSELDGIAVHQLVTGDADDAVTTARFVWDGEDWLASEDVGTGES